MKVLHSKTPLPKVWEPEGAILVGDLKVTRDSRLRAKVVVFEDKKALHAFWKAELGNKLCADTVGAVNGLACEVVDKHGKSRMEVDPRYFCVIGLIKTRLGMEVLTHESVHAAFAYAKRVHAKNLWAGAKELDEELICYPAGRIASYLAIWLRENGMYD